MSFVLLIGIGLLGGAGAVARFAVDRSIAARTGTPFPLGTLGVNLSGALILGVIAGAAVGEDAMHLAATGLLGSYTTFSTWVLESERLAEDGRPWLATLNFALSLALGVPLAWAGLQIGGMA